MGPTAFDQVATVLSYDSARGKPPAYAAQSGYLRLEAGSTVVIADTGPAPPLDSSAAAHAGCLSFEMSGEGGRIVVNCGGPQGVRHGRAAAARRTPAHSTLELDDASSSEFLADARGGAAEWLLGRLGPVLLAGPRTVPVERGTEAGGSLACTASHDGYAARFGLVHERRWTLAPDGSRLDGEDRLRRTGSARESSAPRPLLCFHLHPSVTPTLGPDENAVLLKGPGAERWRFESQSGLPELAPSVYFGGLEGWRPTTQIVVLLPSAEAEPVARWSFARLSGDDDMASRTAPA